MPHPRTTIYNQHPSQQMPLVTYRLHGYARISMLPDSSAELIAVNQAAFGNLNAKMTSHCSFLATTKNSTIGRGSSMVDLQWKSPPEKSVWEQMHCNIHWGRAGNIFAMYLFKVTWPKRVVDGEDCKRVASLLPIHWSCLNWGLCCCALQEAIPDLQIGRSRFNNPNIKMTMAIVLMPRPWHI